MVLLLSWLNRSATVALMLSSVKLQLMLRRLLWNMLFKEVSSIKPANVVPKPLYKRAIIRDRSFFICSLVGNPEDWKCINIMHKMCTWNNIPDSILCSMDLSRLLHSPHLIHLLSYFPFIDFDESPIRIDESLFFLDPLDDRLLDFERRERDF